MNIYNNHRWRKFRKLIIQQKPLCYVCTHNNKVFPASSLDHLIPVTKDNYDMFMFNEDNLDGICHKCHADITRTQKGIDFSTLTPQEAKTLKLKRLRPTVGEDGYF